MKYLKYLCIGLALTLCACATQGGGQVNPLLSVFIPKTLYDYGPTLADDATQACNVGAAKEYNANMVLCQNPSGFASQLPVLPWGITAADVTEGVTALCSTNGYTAGMPATVVAGPAAVCMQSQNPSAHVVSSGVANRY